MNNKLIIEFLEIFKRKEFHLGLISYFPLEVGGLAWENTYNIQIDKTLYEFLMYLENKYKKELKTIENIEQAVIKETNRGMDNKNLPWIYTLTVNKVEVIEFFPYECTLIRKENE